MTKEEFAKLTFKNVIHNGKCVRVCISALAEDATQEHIENFAMWTRPLGQAHTNFDNFPFGHPEPIGMDISIKDHDNWTLLTENNLFDNQLIFNKILYYKIWDLERFIAGSSL